MLEKLKRDGPNSNRELRPIGSHKQIGTSPFPSRFVFLFLLALAIQAKAGMQEGIEAYNGGDYGRALEELRPLAEQGDSYAQFYLGLAYEDSHQDYKEAIILYEKAAKAGYRPAEIRLSLLVEKISSLNTEGQINSEQSNTTTQQNVRDRHTSGSPKVWWEAVTNA